METRSEFEENKALIVELKRRLADADVKIIEGEKVRKKLHNTILVPSFTVNTNHRFHTAVFCY